MAAKCESLQEVRTNIDLIDRQIVGLIAERGEYVEQAARFKATPDAVFDQTRFNEIIIKVRALALDAGTSPDVVEAVYRAMVTGFTEWEKGIVRGRG